MVTFTARRIKPELVAPRRAMPQGCKPLSDVDDQWELRYYQTMLEFFRIEPSHQGKDVAKAIKAAVAEALVYYYPVAGRLRETPGGKLAVDCTGEGVVFSEAEADVRLEELGQPLLPPYPCVEELLCDAGETGDVVGKPLLFMQVTRLKCGGFVVSLRMCRNMVDDFGMMQFIKAIVDLAGGKSHPTVLPVWGREVLTARIPPHITYIYPAHEPFIDVSASSTDDVMLSTPTSQYFLFGPREIAALHSHVPMHLRQTSTTFEVLTAVTWRCRTVALGYKPDQCVRVRFALDARRRKGKHGRRIPRGYYGNAIFCPIIEATVDELCRSPLGHTIGLLRDASRFDISDDDRMESMLHMMAMLRGKPPLTMDRVYVVSDTRHIGEDELNFGWAKRIGGGTVVSTGSDIRSSSRSVSHYMTCKNDAGEEAVVVSLCLPRPAMDRFSKELDSWLNNYGGGTPTFTPSRL